MSYSGISYGYIKTVYLNKQSLVLTPRTLVLCFLNALLIQSLVFLYKLTRTLKLTQIFSFNFKFGTNRNSSLVIVWICLLTNEKTNNVSPFLNVYLMCSQEDFQYNSHSSLMLWQYLSLRRIMISSRQVIYFSRSHNSNHSRECEVSKDFDN